MPPPDRPAGAGDVGWGAIVAVLAAALLVGTGAAVGVVLAVRDPVPASAPPPSPVATADAEVGASDEGYAVWDRNADGTPVRWDPCSPIELVVSGRGGPLGYPTTELVADVEVAARTLARATGLDLVVRGTSDEVPDADRSTVVTTEAGGRRWAPVLVGWRPPGAGGLPLRDVDRGVAVPVAVGPPAERVYVTAQVVLNPEREDLLPGDLERSTSWGATVLHELAHVLGLAHVDDPGELLHTFPGRGPVTLGPGDREGLRAVGADGGCLEVPRPRELDVELPTP